jgi:dihydroorotate dehydrogenase
LPIIGAGGISSAQDAYAKIRAGASLVQLYTALVFQGPELVTDILKGLGRLLDKDGLNHISDAIGKDA